jgi:hypothetical protein
MKNISAVLASQGAVLAAGFAFSEERQLQRLFQNGSDFVQA